MNKKNYQLLVKQLNNGRSEVIKDYRAFKATKGNALHLPPSVYTACVKGFKDKIEGYDLELLKVKEEYSSYRKIEVSVKDLERVSDKIRNIFEDVNNPTRHVITEKLALLMEIKYLHDDVKNLIKGK